jgi:hypothetical protein
VWCGGRGRPPPAQVTATGRDPAEVTAAGRDPVQVFRFRAIFMRSPRDRQRAYMGSGLP